MAIDPGLITPGDVTPSTPTSRRSITFQSPPSGHDRAIAADSLELGDQCRYLRQSSYVNSRYTRAGRAPTLTGNEMTRYVTPRYRAGPSCDRARGTRRELPAIM